MDGETIEAAAAAWVIRRSKKTWAAADQEALDTWLNESTLHRVAYLRLDAVWQQTGRLKALGAGRPSGVVPPAGSGSTGSFQSSSTRGYGSSERDPPLKRLAVLAASLLLVLLGGLFWVVTQMRGGPNEYTTAVGGLQTIHLVDGSQVTLNTNTRVRVYFRGTQRRVELESGEAYFVVAKDPSRPFVVSVADKDVTAVGTEFSVRRTISDLQVFVADGRVELHVSGVGPSQRPTTLDAGTLAKTVTSEVQIVSVPEAEAAQLLSWRTGFIVFRDTPLSDAVVEFNRYLPRKLVIEDPVLDSIKLGGRFRTSNLAAFLSLLQQGFPVTVEETADRIVLKHRT